ncbi:MAG: hypothetical protein IJ106_01995 [Parasporobacterium sp.]|nr:hypothetical protein [Parasporobacterium sp.]
MSSIAEVPCLTEVPCLPEVLCLTEVPRLTSVFSGKCPRPTAARILGDSPAGKSLPVGHNGAALTHSLQTSRLTAYIHRDTMYSIKGGIGWIFS